MNLIKKIFIHPNKIGVFLWILLSSSPMHANEINLYSINTGSFIFHAYDPDKNKNQYFNNQYFSVERKLSKDSKYSFMLGTLLNSESNRCALIGLRRNWWSNDSAWAFKGVYTYTGELFFDSFSHCGDGGTYHKLKEKTGIGFAPYIYHAVQYNFTDYFGVEGGVILPGILVVSIQWSFR